MNNLAKKGTDFGAPVSAALRQPYKEMDKISPEAALDVQRGTAPILETLAGLKSLNAGTPVKEINAQFESGTTQTKAPAQKLDNTAEVEGPTKPKGMTAKGPQQTNDYN